MSAARKASRLPTLRRMHPTRWLDVVSVSVAGIALLLLVMPWGMELTADSPTAARRPSPAAFGLSDTRAPANAMSGQDSLVERVVHGNVFSATRRAPVTRFVVPGQAAMDVTPTMPGMTPAGADVGEADTFPRLSAIVALNGERWALLQFAASDGAPRLYRMNDVRAGSRVVRIEPDRVVLASRAGTRTLRLSQRATPDSPEKRP